MLDRIFDAVFLWPVALSPRVRGWAMACLTPRQRAVFAGCLAAALLLAAGLIEGTAPRLPY